MTEMDVLKADYWAGCDKLRYITLRACTWTEFISTHPKLKKVTITACPKLTTVSITDCPKLESVTITTCPKLTTVTLPPGKRGLVTLANVTVREA
jgi:hypothetical protein